MLTLFGTTLWCLLSGLLIVVGTVGLWRVTKSWKENPRPTWRLFLKSSWSTTFVILGIIYCLVPLLFRETFTPLEEPFQSLALVAVLFLVGVMAGLFVGGGAWLKVAAHYWQDRTIDRMVAKRLKREKERGRRSETDGE